MVKKPTYEELEQKIQELEHAAFNHKVVEESLRESETKYKLLADNTVDCIWLLNMDLVFTYINPAIYGMAGFTTEEWIGSKLQEHSDKHHFEEMAGVVLSALKRLPDNSEFQYEGVLLKKNGDPFHVEIIGKILLDEKGTPVGLHGLTRDITKRKRSEEALRKERDRAQKYLDIAGVMFVGIDRHQDVILVNRKACDVLGYKQEDIIGKNWFDNFLPENRRSKMKGSYGKLMDEEIELSKKFEFPVLTKNATERLIAWRNTTIKDENGNTIGTLSSGEDITQRKLAELALQEKTDFLDKIIESSALSLWISDEKGTAIRTNPACLEFFGAAEDEVIGKYNLLQDEVIKKEGFMPVIERMFEKGEVVSIVLDYNFEAVDHVDVKKATHKIINSTFTPVLNSDGKVTNVIAQAIDLTEIKKTEKALRESEDNLRRIIDTIHAGIVIIEEQSHTIVDVNSAAAALIGVPKEEILGKVCHNYICPAEKGACPITDLEQKIDNSERTLMTAAGKSIPVLKYAAPIRLNSKNCIIEIFLDITEKKEIESRLLKAKKMEAIGILAGGVAHDLNNVLSGIVGYPDLLLLQLPEDSPLRKPILTIQKTGEKAAAIVQDLLTLARRGIANYEVLNLNTVVSEYLGSPEHEKLKSLFPDVEVEANVEADLLNILGSPVHISKVIMNLVSNSAEAIGVKGQISISTENQYIDRPIYGYENIEKGDYVTLTVSDSGTGISPEDMERIFEPFYSKKEMGKSGTGLGMAVVWGTVKDHRGNIDVQSTEGKGTTFRLYFPVTRQEQSKAQVGLSIENYMGQGQSVLIVDDVKEQQELLSEMLETLGYSVSAASSGEEAVEYLQKNSADLLVLDMIMNPGMDGLDTYKKIIESHPKQKAIIASGYSETDRVKKAQILGAGQYIKKPYTLKKISIAIKNELEK